MGEDTAAIAADAGAVSTPAPVYKRRYFPDLDSWRFVLFMAVFCQHSFDSPVIRATGPLSRKLVHLYFGNAHPAVFFFFVMSGFLITYQLLEEKYFMGGLSLGRFYLRRLLRICPQYLVILFIGFVLWPILTRHGIGDPPNPRTDYRLYLAFMPNYESLWHGLTNCGALNILWTTGVEEQFYLVWPLMLLFTPTKHLWKAMLGIVLLSLVYRFMLMPNVVATRKDTLACLSDLSIGGLIAFASIRSKSFVERIAVIRRGWIMVLYAVTFLVYSFQDQLFPGMMQAISRLVFGVLFGAIILEQNYCAHSFFKLRSIGLFRKMGKYTYGLYGFHMFAVFFAWIICKHLYSTHGIWQFLLIQFPLAIVLAVVFGIMCYRYIETPALRLKSRLSPKIMVNRTSMTGVDSEASIIST